MIECFGVLAYHGQRYNGKKLDIYGVDFDPEKTYDLWYEGYDLPVGRGRVAFAGRLSRAHVYRGDELYDLTGSSFLHLEAELFEHNDFQRSVTRMVTIFPKVTLSLVMAGIVVRQDDDTVLEVAPDLIGLAPPPLGLEYHYTYLWRKAPLIDRTRYPRTCPLVGCGAPAYVGAVPAAVDCSNPKCRHHRTNPSGEG